MPNLVFALQPAENWSMYPFFRYVHAEDVSTNFVPEFPLGEPAGDIFGSSRLRGFNLEWVNVFTLQDAGFDWFEANPDYFKNYTGDRSETFTMKYVGAQGIKDGLFMLCEFQHPVGGSQTNDYTIKIRLDWYPNFGSHSGGKCRPKCGRRACCR